MLCRISHLVTHDQDMILVCAKPSPACLGSHSRVGVLLVGLGLEYYFVPTVCGILIIKKRTSITISHPVKTTMINGSTESRIALGSAILHLLVNTT